MNTLDYAVLFGAILLIALYGILRTRGRKNLHDYLRGQKRSPWFVIGLSVMATQASAVTFLSTPGQGYAGGLGFVQNYFAIPIAMVIIAAFFLPIFRRFNVYTAYEYLGTRFDMKTRLLAAALFLFQRALGAGITIYAPAIVLSTVFGWNLQLTIIASGVVVLIYTVVGGSDAVTHTQKYQLGVIFIGMVIAFIILVRKIPCSFSDALTLAGHFNKTNAVSFNPDPRENYTVWTGMLAGIFLMLSYFGTDQTQVQRYISGDNLRDSRLGLMFNALFKIPMQFGILLLGVMLFVFYQFNPSPVLFDRSGIEAKTAPLKEVYARLPDIDPANTVTWTIGWTIPPDGQVPEGSMKIFDQFESSQAAKQSNLQQWVVARRSNDSASEKTALLAADQAGKKVDLIRQYVKDNVKAANPGRSSNDNDYVFITFILDNLPHGLIGLLVVCFFFATLQAKSAELNALASCTTVDFYRYLIRPPHDNNHAPDHAAGAHTTSERHYVRASKLFTIFWGLVAIGIALSVHLAKNLIETSNTIGSLFSGPILGIFLIAFFLKFIRGTAAFCGALAAQGLVFAMYFTLPIAYLWYNLIGCLAALLFALLLQLLLGTPKEPRGFPVVADSPSQNPTL